MLRAPGWRSRLSVRLQPGHDLAVREFEPRVRLWADGSEPGACFRCCVSLSLCPSPVHALFLSVPKKKKKIHHALGCLGVGSGICPLFHICKGLEREKIVFCEIISIRIPACSSPPPAWRHFLHPLFPPSLPSENADRDRGGGGGGGGRGSSQSCI